MQSPTPRSVILPALLLVALLGNPGPAAERLSYPDLVARMTDLARLAELPPDGERCAQWSSYDRASRYDEASGKYIRWDANGDGGGIIRQEGSLSVMAEMPGPGCIWRIWSARAMKGHVKIYLDGSAEPAVDLPFIDYFEGNRAPFNYPLLSYNLDRMESHGQNLYFPIPYQKSCKIVAEKGWGNYYHFTYTTYPSGTQLPTFSAALAKENQAALQKVNDFFRDSLGRDPAGPRSGEQRTVKALDIAAGATASLPPLAGPRAISAIRVRGKFANRADEMAALRQLALQIHWDGQPQPAVWTPLGDFFGTAPGENRYKTLTTGMTADGYYALWYMPFDREAAIAVRNEGSEARRIELEIVHAPLARPFAGLGHFHAKWHRDTEPLPADRWPDWLMLRTQGRGRFCGVMLHVWNPRGGWWGEGDEKFFVDGEKFPSTIGTGSEDYFGYAWCDPRLFQRPYHAQTMTEKNRGHQSVLRWHVVDNVPFAKSLEATIEKYYRNEDRGTLYACLPVWYLAPQGSDPYRPQPVESRHGYYVKPTLAAGSLRLAGDPPGDVQIQQMGAFRGGKWRNNEQLWWTGAKPGNRLELSFEVPEAGDYEVRLVLTKARDYGVVQLHLNDRKMGDPIDLYHPQVVPTEPLLLSTIPLSAGEHRLSVVVMGKNPQAVPRYMFGVSHIELRKVPKRD